MDLSGLQQIERAAEHVETLDMLVNNAGLALYDDQDVIFPDSRTSR